jgi:hypothetical protein
MFSFPHSVSFVHSLSLSNQSLYLISRDFVHEYMSVRVLFYLLNLYLKLYLHPPHPWHIIPLDHYSVHHMHLPTYTTSD